MSGMELDPFVARFKHLATKAGFGHNDPATKDLFARALTRSLLAAIIDREQFKLRTATLDEWITAAQEEIQCYENKSTMLRKWPTTWQSPKHKGGFCSHNTHHHHCSSYVHPNDRSVPMDVNAARKATTDEAKKKHCLEGRCYECSKQGHMARNCPNKLKRPQGQYTRQQQPFNKRQQQCSPNKPNFRNTFARVAEMLDSDDEEEFENLLAKDSISEHNELNISDLAARTA